MDDITDANSIDSAKPSLKPKSPQMPQMNAPVSAAVATTPKVASTSPSPTIGLTSEMRVSIPPEKRITLSAMIPTNCVA